MELLTKATELSPPVLLAVVLNALGFALKKSPMPDWVIPLFLPTLGAAAFPFIAEVGKVSYQVQNPIVFNCIIGAALGFGAVGINQAFRQFLDRKTDTKDDADKPPAPPAK
jgi:hypothetical protein